MIVAWILSNWRMVLLGVLLLAISVQTARLSYAKRETQEVQAAFDKFKGGVAALGEKAKADALAKQTADKERKDKADAENKRTADALRADIERLRRERDNSRSRFVSAATSCPASAEGAEKYRAEFERAYRILTEGLRAVGDEGSRAVTDLNTSKDWAN